MLGQRAGSTVSVYAQVQYNAESPKQDSRRFNSIVKTKYCTLLVWVYESHAVHINHVQDSFSALMFLGSGEEPTLHPE